MLYTAFNIGNKKEHNVHNTSNSAANVNTHSSINENIYLGKDLQKDWQLTSFFAIALLLIIVFILFRRLFKLDDQVSELSKQIGELETKIDISLKHLEEDLKDLKKIIINKVYDG